LSGLADCSATIDFEIANKDFFTIVQDLSCILCVGALHVHAGTNHDFHNCCNDLYYQDSKADLINEPIVNDMETEPRWTCACTTTDTTCVLNDYRTVFQSLALTIEEDFLSVLATTLRGSVPMDTWL